MAANYWLKLYYEMLDDPKVARLPDSSYRRFIECLLLAGETDSGGLLPAIEDMSWRLRLSETALSQDMSRLAMAGIVELREHDQGERWFVTKFADRQAAVSGAERVKRHRERNKKREYNGHDNGPVTNRYTDIDIDIDTDEDTDEDTDKRTKPRGRESAPNPFWSDLPGSLKTDAFIAAWASWLSYTMQADVKFTPAQSKIALRDLEDIGPERAVVAINESIKRGWRSIFEPRSDFSQKPVNGRSPAPLVDVAAIFDELGLSYE